MEQWVYWSSIIGTTYKIKYKARYKCCVILLRVLLRTPPAGRDKLGLALGVFRDEAQEETP